MESTNQPLDNNLEINNQTVVNPTPISNQTLPTNPVQSNYPSMPSNNQAGNISNGSPNNFKIRVWILIALSLIVLVGGLVLGYAALIGAIFGILAAQFSKKNNYRLGLIAGLVVGLLNFIVLIIAQIHAHIL